MPGLNTKFTDNNLKLFYANLLNHYQDCFKRSNPMDINAIYNEMYFAVRHTVESPEGSLYHLLPLEKNKVYESFNAIFRALPIYRNLSQEQYDDFNPQIPVYDPQIIYVVTPYRYNCNDSLLFDWLLLSSISHNLQHHSHHHGSFSHGGGFSSGSFRHEHGGSSSNTDCGKLFALLLVIALAALAAVLTFIALYYILKQFADSLERFWFNEGWLKGMLMMASSIAFGAGTTALTFTLAAIPLIALATLAGLNPIGVVVTGAILLTIMGAAIGCYAMNLLYDSIDKKRNTDAMDPNDPCRYRLTATDEGKLIANNIDPIKAKCAMVALRAEIESLVGKDQPMPSFFSRHFGKGAKIQEKLQQLRELRNGELSEVKAGELVFDCSKVYPNSYQQPVPGQQPSEPPPYYLHY